MKHIWTQSEIDYLKQHYSDTPMSDMINHLNVGKTAIHSKANVLGLRKSLAFIAATAQATARPNSGRFQKGHIPSNKGKRQSEYMTADAIERTKATRFQKGHIPHNTKQVGHERICNKDGYVYIKVEGSRKMVLKHRLVWESHYGAIPKGYNVQFKDGNRQNCDISNLYLISRQEQLSTQNGMYRYPAELQKTIRNLSKLKKRIKKYEQTNRN